MTAASSPGMQLVRALKFPLTDPAILIAIVSFTLLTLLAREAGLLGLWLGVILIPALWRYLLMLLEARAHGRATPVAGIETFNFIDNFWSLTPLVLIALAVWGSIFLQRQISPLAGQALAAALIAVLPASTAVLALTRSPFESLDPRAIVRMIIACGPAYGLAPGAHACIRILRTGQSRGAAPAANWNRFDGATLSQHEWAAIETMATTRSDECFPIRGSRRLYGKGA